MDTFFEQLIKIKKTPADILKIAGIWIAAILLCAALYLLFLMSGGALLFICFFGAVGVVWGAIKLSGRLSIEYEYIFTNGDLDFDKIIAKSSRKRMLTVNCADIEKYGRYNPAAKPSGSVSKTYLFCEAEDADAMYLIAPHKNEGNVLVVFTPDERMKGAIEKVVPRIAQ